MMRGFPAKGQDRSKEGGYTLLEMVIAITLLATIVLVVTGAMRLGYRSVASGEKKIEGLERFRASFTIVDSQVQSAVPLTYDDQGVKKTYFQGSRDFLRMVTNYSIWGGRRGYVLAEYRVQLDMEGKLILAASESPVGAVNKRVTTLFKGFDQIFFEYFFQDATVEAGRWVDLWTDETKTPLKVRISLVSGRKGITLIIPMRAEMPRTGAAFDPAITERALIHLASPGPTAWRRFHGA